MEPVWGTKKITERHGYGIEEFEKAFREICESHHRDNRALLFAFILFDQQSAEFRKMLKDKDYWESLDNIAGNTISIFHFKIDTDDGETDAPGNTRFLSLAQGLLTNQDFRSYLPCFLLIQITDNEVLTEGMTLSAEGTEPAFNEIRSILRVIVEALNRVQPGYDKHTVFELARDALETRRRVTFIQRVLTYVPYLSDFFTKLPNPRG